MKPLTIVYVKVNCYTYSRPHYATVEDKETLYRARKAFVRNVTTEESITSKHTIISTVSLLFSSACIDSICHPQFYLVNHWA